jgi:hypothetical protein
MSQLKLGVRLLLINSFALHPLTFFKASATPGITEEKTTDPSLATAMHLEGIGRINLGQLRDIVVAKGAAATKHKISVTAATAAQIKLGDITLPDTEINFRLKIRSTDARSEFASKTGREENYWSESVYVNPGDDESDVLTQLAQKLSGNRQLFPEADGAGDIAKFEGGVFTLEATDSRLVLTLERTTIERQNIRNLPTFAPVTVVKQSEGRGNYALLRTIIHETPGTNDLYAIGQSNNVPARRTLYTNVRLTTLTARPDLHGGAGAASEAISQTPEYELYVAENSGNDDELDKILTFLNRTSGTKTLSKADGTTAVLADLTAVAPSGEQPDDVLDTND